MGISEIFIILAHNIYCFRLSPEVMQDLKFSSASDVWSYGVLLWEITSKGQRPWEGLQPKEVRQSLHINTCTCMLVLELTIRFSVKILNIDNICVVVIFYKTYFNLCFFQLLLVTD